MNVCFLTNQLAPGGAPTLLLDIVRHTDSECGIDYTVCYIEGEDSLVKDLKAAGARVVSFDAEFKFDPRALWRMVRFFQHESFDLLHAHLPYSQTLGRLVAQFGVDGPVVSTQHNFPSEYHSITRILERTTRPLDHATIAVSQAVMRAFVDTAAGRIDPDREGKWHTIYNGVDIEKINAATAGSDAPSVREKWDIGSELVFLNVGRYRPPKAQKILVRAMQYVVRDLPKAKLLIVGWGPLEEELQRLVRKLRLEDSVFITGRAVPIEPYYAAADAFAFSSISESFGIVVLEAMAAELPVVASDIPVMREIINDRKTGMLVPPNDPSRLADAMIQLGNPELRAKLGKGGYSRAADQFDIDRTVNAHLDLYRELCERDYGS